MPAYVYCVVQRAEDVLTGDPSGTSDCFVRAFLEGQKKQAKKTRVISKNLNPVWNMALSIPFPKGGGNDANNEVLLLELFDDNWTGKELLGFATVSLAGLAAGEARDLQLDLQWREGVKLKYSTDRPLSRGFGRLFVRVGAGATKNPPKDFLECSSASQGAEDLTKVPEGLLLSPVKRLGVSGGTAPFFALQLTPEHRAATGRPTDAFIGKDLSHAEGEALVYEEILATLAACEAGVDPNGLGDLLRFTMEYKGIFTAPEDTGPDDVGEQQAPLDILVLQNLRCGCEKLRLLDIKMGEKTASAGWKGKSHTAAKRQSVVDGMTNSAAEGFRLEGFDGAPESLTSMNPLVNVPGALKGLVTNAEKADKKARRVLMQRLSASDVASHYLRLPNSGSVELQEIVMHETLSKLSALAVACRKVKIPQKWVGSSVALGFDAAARFMAGDDEAAVRSQVIVQIFDWGRSELNVETKYAAMTVSERADRIEFWNNYKMGINKLSFEIARFYHHRFNNADSRPKLVAKVWDLDTLTDNDLIGFAELELGSSSSPITVPLSNDSCDKPCGTLTYATEWVEAPSTSRLAGWWRVTLQRAAGLLAMDFNGLSDPFATLTASSSDGAFRTTWQTCVVERDLNPVWDETFQVPVARPGTRRVAEALESKRPWLKDISLALPAPEGFASILPAPVLIHDAMESRRNSFVGSFRGSSEALKNKQHFDAWNKVLDTVQCPEELSPLK